MDEQAALVFYNANVITLDPLKPKARAVVVKGGQIIHVVENDEQYRSDANSLDCEGKTIIPGFNDAHCHFLAFAASLLAVDCTPSAVSSIAEIKHKICQRAQTVPAGEWIRSAGYDEFQLAEQRHPTRRDLDEAAPNHPVKLVHRSRHACVLNSLALSRVGITNETPEPPGGMIDRNLDSGQPNGILYEMNEYVDRVIPQIATRDMEKGIKLANDICLSKGVTSLQDATVSNDLSAWKTFAEFKKERRIVPRLSMMAGLSCLHEIVDSDIPPRYGDADMRLGALKVVLSEARGSLHPGIDELRRSLLEAHRKGFQVAIHAIEESTVTAAIEMIEYVINMQPKSDHRHRIEHCSICTDALLDRIKSSGALVVTQPSFVYFSGERYRRTVPLEQQPLLYRIGSFVRSGFITAAGSDCPIAHIDPLLSMHVAVNRVTQSKGEFFLQERVSPEIALRIHTLNPAFASFEEEIKGSISVGKLADMVILSADPLTVPPEEIRDIKIEASIIGGEIVWRS